MARRQEEARRPVPQPEPGPRQFWSRVGEVWQAAVRDKPYLAMAIMVNPFALQWLIRLPYEERKAEVKKFIDKLRMTLEEACGLHHHDSLGVVTRTLRPGPGVGVDWAVRPSHIHDPHSKLDEF